ncbi:MAG TPA: RNA-binding S4 domain-containing protein [Thiobacillaceae bacterium]|nr:RNA-binding S4 domain-containing protein [Thiobacillaceae bacterium]
MQSAEAPPGRMRLDKWLWAARFFKTRSLARQALEQGRVKLNGERAKASREIGPADRLEVRIGDAEWSIRVRALAMQRGPAPVAQTLYAEEPESLARRQEQMAERRLAMHPAATVKGRPTKRDRRLIHRFTGE